MNFGGLYVRFPELNQALLKMGFSELVPRTDFFPSKGELLEDCNKNIHISPASWLIEWLGPFKQYRNCKRFQVGFYWVC